MPDLAPTGTLALLEQLACLRETGEYHDLAISCGNHTWKAHRAIVCTRSEFFRKACQPGFQEGETLSIDLPEEDPVIVGELINYLYTLDYNDLQEFRGDRESPTSQPLAFNANMYIIGDRYQLTELKKLAAIKFSKVLPVNWDKENFSAIVRAIYDNTMPSDRELRECLVPVLRNNKQVLRADSKFMDVVKSGGDFTVDLIDAWDDKNQSANGPSSSSSLTFHLGWKCWRCGSHQDKYHRICPFCGEDFH